MGPSEKSGSQAVHRAGRWCIWGGVVSVVVALITGFAGMAHKDVCLPQASHCNGDLIQNALIVLYFGSLIALAVCVLAGLILAVFVAIRAVTQQQRGA
jgi:hypothetical protein